MGSISPPSVSSPFIDLEEDESLSGNPMMETDSDTNVPSEPGISPCGKRQRMENEEDVWDHFTMVGGDESGDGDSSDMVVREFNLEKLRTIIAKMIITTDMPFGFVEAEGFRMLCSTIQPNFQLPSRATVMRDCMEIYETEREKLMEIIRSSVYRVSLSVDAWTSAQTRDYMCLTAHFIDNKWNIHKRILNFCRLPDLEGDTIGKQVDSCLLDWGIDRIFTVTIDNDHFNDGAIGYLRRHIKGNVLEGEYLHMSPCAHIMNLVVSEGLEDYADSITKVRNAVTYVRSSSSMMEKFKRYRELEKIERKNLVRRDIPTRWNSTYLMLEAAEKFEKAFERLEEDDDGQYTRCFSIRMVSPPTNDDWGNVRALVKVLKIFYDCTLRLYGSLHVTPSAYFQELCFIKMHLSELCKSGDHLLSSIALSMKRKYDKYWGRSEVINWLIFVSVVLDPRCKLGVLEFCFKQMYENSEADILLANVKDVLYRLYEEYNTVFGALGRAQSPNEHHLFSCEAEITVHKDYYPKHPFWGMYEEYKANNAHLENKSEVDQYLSDSCEVRTSDLDILNWWKMNSAKYPILAQVAQDVMAITISTVHSELAFSTEDRVLDPFRSSLAPKMLEALVCAKNWLRDPNEIDLHESMDDDECYDTQSESDAIGKSPETTDDED